MKPAAKTAIFLLIGIVLVIFGIIGLIENENAETSILGSKNDDTSSYLLLVGALLTIGGIIRLVRERNNRNIR